MSKHIGTRRLASTIRVSHFWVVFLVSTMAFSIEAQVADEVEVSFVGAEQGDWGGKKGAAIGPPDGVCRNMGAVGKVNLVSGFSFDLPSDALITNITAFIKAASQGGQNIGIQLATNAAVDPPTGVSSTRLMPSHNGDGGNCAETTFTSIDGSPDDWDLGADPYGPDPSTIVNTPEFGMVLQKVVTSEVKVDAICLQITYSSAGGQGLTESCTAEPPENTITLTKAVTGDNGGTAVDTDWTLTATGQTETVDIISGVTGDPAITDAPVKADDYVLTESSVTGYSPASPTAVACLVNGSGSLTGNTLTLNEGDSANCTFFNDDDPVSLTLVKTITNKGIGPAAADDWTLEADGPGDNDLSGATGTSDVTSDDLSAGTYALSESGPGGYAAGDWNCVGGSQNGPSVTLALGESATCTINNEYILPQAPKPVPASNTWVLTLLTMLILVTGWHFGSERVRRK